MMVEKCPCWQVEGQWGMCCAEVQPSRAAAVCRLFKKPQIVSFLQLSKPE